MLITQAVSFIQDLAPPVLACGLGRQGTQLLNRKGHIVISLFGREQEIRLFIALGHALRRVLDPVFIKYRGEVVLQALSGTALPAVQHLVGKRDKIVNGGEAT